MPLPIEQGLGLKAPRRRTLQKFRAQIEAEQVLADELETVIRIESGDRHVFELSFTPPGGPEMAGRPQDLYAHGEMMGGGARTG